MTLIPLHLQIHPQLQEDHRPFLRITLVETDRPYLQQLWCMSCGAELGRVEGAKLFEISDVDDNSWDTGKPRLSIRCPGHRCGRLYRFTLN